MSSRLRASASIEPPFGAAFLCRSRAGLLATTFATALLGCAAPLPHTDGWHPVTLPGKAATRYRLDHKDGRPAWRADADRSSSLWRRHLRIESQALGPVEFSWWVPALIDGANVGRAEHADAPARLVFAFGGDSRGLSSRNRMLFELAQTLTGEAPPYATLVYVWETDAPVGSVIPNPRTDRIRSIVVESGPARLKQWRSYRRSLADDYRRAFGEEPGPLISVALMTDADNTRSQARAWYGEIVLPSGLPPLPALPDLRMIPAFRMESIP